MLLNVSGTALILDSQLSGCLIRTRTGPKLTNWFLQQGQAIHVGALMRLDFNHASVNSIYVTVWASPNVSLHMGKIENADEILSKHAGVRLQVYICVTVALKSIILLNFFLICS